MNLIIQTILGNQTELTQQGRLNGQSRDSVTLNGTKPTAASCAPPPKAGAILRLNY